MTIQTITLTTRITFRWWFKPAAYLWASWQIVRHGPLPDPVTLPSWVMRGVNIEFQHDVKTGHGQPLI